MTTYVPSILPRNEFLKVLAKHAKQAQEHQRLIGLLFCDIRNFWKINNQYGYDIGDSTISEIFKRLEPMARSEDGLHRTGANEFALVIPFMEHPTIAQLVAIKALKLLDESDFCDKKRIRCKAALGLAFIDPELSSPDKLCLLAETALNQTKASKKPYVIINDQELLKGYELEEELDFALNNNEFELFFQPKINLHTNCPNQSEALIYWRKFEDQLIGPDQFIPAAEEFRLIQPITRWVVQNTLRTMKNYPEKISNHGVSINISGSCLEINTLSRLVENSLTLWGVDPSRLTLEITESIFMENLDSTMSVFAALRDKLGIRISIDDFGTGYSSLEYFKHIPADELKIDRSFVMGIKNSPADRKIVELIVQLAENFNLDVVAEGVEDQATLNIVKDIGCDYVQGYYYSKPLAIDDYIAWVNNYLTSR